MKEVVAAGARFFNIGSKSHTRKIKSLRNSTSLPRQSWTLMSGRTHSLTGSSMDCEQKRLRISEERERRRYVLLQSKLQNIKCHASNPHDYLRSLIRTSDTLDQKIRIEKLKVSKNKHKVKVLDREVA